LGDSGTADDVSSGAEFFKRQPALFYRGRQSKVPRRSGQQKWRRNCPKWPGIRLLVRCLPPFTTREAICR